MNVTNLARSVGFLSFASILLSANVQAIALGEISLASTQQQPLNLQIELIEVDDTAVGAISAKLAGPAQFLAAGLTYQAWFSRLDVSVVKSGSALALQVQGDHTVNQTELDLIFEVDYLGGRLLSEYRLKLPAFGTPVAAVALVKIESQTPVSLSAPAPAPPTPTLIAVQQASAMVLVKPGQTLWRIAVNNSRPGVTSWQMLMALYKTNPKAFRRGDIRQLLAHSRLTLPSLGQAQSLSAKQAKAAYDALVKPVVKPAPKLSVKPAVKVASQAPVVNSQQVQLQQQLNQQLEQQHQQVADLAQENENLAQGVVLQQQGLKQLNKQKSLLQSNMQSLGQEFEITQANLGQVQAELEQVRSMLEQAQSNVLDARNAQLNNAAGTSWLQGANTPRVLVLLLIPVVLVVGLIWWFIGRRKSRQTSAVLMPEPNVVDEPPLTLDPLAEYDARRDASYNTELKPSSFPMQEQEQAQTQSQSSTIEDGQLHLSSEVDALLKQRQPQAIADEPVEYLSPEEDMNTKLDLAQSYCDMGQIAEAQAVLQIVLNKGNAEQQTQAGLLLSRLNS